MFTLYRQRFALMLLLLMPGFYCFAQTPKRICVMGSSSAFGFFGNPEQYPRDSAWAFKVKKYYKNLGIIDTLYNIGVNGIDPYDGMPTSFIPPPGRNAPDPNHNITKALNFNPKPDILIVNFPTNHYDYFSFGEVISCLQVIKDSANARGVQCYITTTQPRDNFSPSERQKLKDLKGLIEGTFGFWSLDFWTGVAVDSNLKIIPALAFGDMVHLNPAGHTILANKVIAKNIFFSAVAVNFGTVNAQRQSGKVLINWQVFQQGENERFIIQRSSAGTDFSDIGMIPSGYNSSNTQSYSFVDADPAVTNLFYRIVAVDPAGIHQSSQVVAVKPEDPADHTDFIFPTITSDKISLLLHSNKTETVTLVISDIQGKKIMSGKAVINSNQIYPIPVSQLPAGSYFLTTEYDGKMGSHRFMKL